MTYLAQDAPRFAYFGVLLVMSPSRRNHDNDVTSTFVRMALGMQTPRVHDETSHETYTRGRAVSFENFVCSNLNGGNKDVDTRKKTARDF